MTKPLRICLIMQGSRDWIGGTEYIKNIIFALASLPGEARPSFEVYLLCHEAIEIDTLNQIKPHLDGIFFLENDLKPVTIVNRIKWKLARLLFRSHDLWYSSFFKKEKFDFIYPYYDLGNRRTPYHTAAWIADFQHKYFPEFFSKEEINKRDKRFSQMAGNASKIIVSSKTAQTDLQKFSPVANQKIKILSFKTAPSSSVFTIDSALIGLKYHLPDRFFLVSNQFWQHKNHLVLFEALKLLREKAVYPAVVCTGHIYDNRHKEYSDIIFSTIHQFDLAKQVFLLGLIPKDDQMQLMRRSLAVIQPSLFEGWSTVVEDARCLGKTIILSDLPVHLEQNPPFSHYFQRNSAEELANLISSLWESQPIGPEQEKEFQARKYSVSEVEKFGYSFLEIANNV